MRPSVDFLPVYGAIDFDTAIASALKKRESELREMEAKKRKLKELSQQQRFRPSDEVSTFKIVNSIKELIAVAMPLIPTARNGLLPLLLT